MWAEKATALPAVEAGPERPSLTSPLDSHRRIRAVLFDLDGTLYQQSRMRMLMAIELSTLLVTRPWSLGRQARALAAYRNAQEALRLSDYAITPTTQLEFAAERTGLAIEEVEETVNEWMFERPLKYLRLCRAAGLSDLLSFLGREGLETGVLSDYPAEAKLDALGVAGRFSVVLCSSDPEVGALKPHPRGFLRACERWRIDPREVLVVGDRSEVDAEGAAAAGMPCVIVGRSPRASANQAGVRFVSSLERLQRVLTDRS
jgi:phosphoglycolate phosphatase/putative hydrolase of the HAD superfamily